MSFLAPAWLGVAGAAAAALIVVHFFARQRPRPALLPTARFVPDVAARAPSLASTPTDLLLLLLRLLAVAAIGAALAGPVRAPARRRVARVVVVDRIGARSESAASDSARAWVRNGDTLVDLPPVRPSADPPGLSAGLISAIRAATMLRERADSIELVIVSPFALASFDAATDSIRRLWPGRARLVHVDGATLLPLPRLVLLNATADDPLRATIALLGARAGPVVRIDRGNPAARPADMDGGVLLRWPRRPGAAWPAASIDTVAAVAAGGAVVVASFVRSATLRAAVAPDLAIAHWVDGTPAAIESPAGTGCARDVAIALPEAGDLVLRRSLRTLVDVLTEPCGGAARSTPASDARTAALLGAGPLMPARAAVIAPRRASAASAGLFALAAMLLLAEMVVRPRARAT